MSSVDAPRGDPNPALLREAEPQPRRGSLPIAATITTRHEPTPAPADPLADAALCAACPKLCSTTCPVQAATGRESAAPWRISRAITSAQRAGWTPVAAKATAQCTGCGACSRACLPGVSLPDASRAARAAAAAAGAALPAAAAMAVRIADTGSPRRTDAQATTLTDGADPTAPTALFFGCTVQSTQPQIGHAARRLFRAAGEPVRCLGDEPCCGAAAFDLGLVDAARALASRAAAALGDATRVVPLSPGCARVIRDEWPRWGLTPPEVVTAPEWLATALTSGVLTSRGEYGDAIAVTWHDPCTLARGLGVVTAPRDALAALGATVREPSRSGLDTRCSGAGAAYPLVDAGGAADVAAARRGELEALGAPVVTACPAAAQALGARDLLELAAGRLLGPA